MKYTRRLFTFSCMHLILLLLVRLINTHQGMNVIINSFLVDDCSLINDCFNCSSYLEEDISCQWTAQHKCTSSSSASYYSKWYESYSQCESDMNALNLSSIFCNDSDLNEIPLRAEVRTKGYLFGSVNLYCYWSIDVEPLKSIFVNFTKHQTNNSYDDDDDEFFALEIIKDDASELTYNLQEGSYSNSFESVKKVTFRYLMKNPKPVNPFSMSITYQEDAFESYVTVLIVIGVVICLCIVSCVLFWYCGRSMIQKSRNLAQGRFGADHISDRHDNQSNSQFNNRNELNLRQIEKQKIERNRALLVELFKNEYKAIEYNKLCNKYASNCTVCLENYFPTVLVIKISCNHLFHSKCIKQWCEENIKHPKCPNCMKDIIISIQKIEEPTCSHNHNDVNANVNEGNLVQNQIVSSRRSNGAILRAPEQAFPLQRQNIQNDIGAHNAPMNNNLISIIRYTQLNNINGNIGGSSIHEMVLENIDV